MSSMLDQAIIDATALREAAIKSAEQAVVEKYSTEIKEAVEQLMEENDFEENKTVDEQIVEADEKGEGYAFVEDTELSDLEQNDLVDIDVKALFEEVQQEQLQEEVEIDDELLEEDVEISDELIDQLVEEIMTEGTDEAAKKKTN
jgi:ribosomal protein S17E